MNKNKVIALAVFALFCIIFWNALDYLYTVFIAHSTYGFSVFDDVCLPAVIGLTVGMFTVIRKDKSGK